MTHASDVHVLIAGGGLGGLSAALALRAEGFEVTILEQAAQLGEVGAGVQISANGSRILHGYGLADALDAVAFRPERGEMRHFQTGETMISRELGGPSVERFGFPYYHLHRADLLDALSAAVNEAAPQALHLGCKVVSVEQNSGGADQPTSVTAHSADGRSFTGDVLIGCDGIHSEVRAQLHGASAPRFTGCVAWRTTLPVDALPSGHVRPVASNWLGQGGHFVHYYLRRGELVNCVGCIEQDDWLAESWSAEGDPAEFAADFAGWHDDLQVLIAAATQCYRWGLFDRDPMPAWRKGNVTLLGDACHPMLPFMAQGAVMSIEDGRVLAASLRASVQANAPLAKGLELYESLRKERTSRVQAMSRENKTLFHNVAAMTKERLAGHRSAHEWLYGYDTDELDYRVS